jgi:ADP-ribose pyrophosphatase YjhB (NUDIX family)
MPPKVRGNAYAALALMAASPKATSPNAPSPKAAASSVLPWRSATATPAATAAPPLPAAVLRVERRRRRQQQQPPAPMTKVLVVLVARVADAGAGAGGDPDGGAVYLCALRHRLSGDWTFVGGTLEPRDASADDAAQREMDEESYYVFRKHADLGVELDRVASFTCDLDYTHCAEAGAGGASPRRRVPTHVYIMRVSCRDQANGTLPFERLAVITSRFREEVLAANADMAHYHRARDAVIARHAVIDRHAPVGTETCTETNTETNTDRDAGLAQALRRVKSPWTFARREMTDLVWVRLDVADDELNRTATPDAPAPPLAWRPSPRPSPRVWYEVIGRAWRSLQLRAHILTAFA